MSEDNETLRVLDVRNVAMGVSIVAGQMFSAGAFGVSARLYCEAVHAEETALKMVPPGHPQTVTLMTESLEALREKQAKAERAAEAAYAAGSTTSATVSTVEVPK